MSPIAIHAEEEKYVNPSESREGLAEAEYKNKSIEVLTNDGILPPEKVGWLPSLPADSSDAVLKKELDEKGVLHIKGAMPREYVMEHRKWTACTGILKEGTEPVDGIFCGHDQEKYLWPKVVEYNTKTVDEFSNKEDYANICARMHYEDWTNDFSGNKYEIEKRNTSARKRLTSDLLDLVKRLFPSWTSPGVVRRQIFRTNVPHAGSATSTHYDQLYFRYGPPTAITCWIPIGDTPPEGGGLMYLDHSKPLGEEIEAEYTQMSKDRKLTDDEAKYAYNVNDGVGMEAGKYAMEKGKHKKWLLGDYEAGDVVFHHMYPEDRIRLSADLRFIDFDGKYDHRWLEYVNTDIC